MYNGNDFFKSNVSEGVQENLQETIARANENHYVEAFKKQGPSSALYGKGANKRTYEVQNIVSVLWHFDIRWCEKGA